MKAVHKVIIGFILLVVIGLIVMKTSSYMGAPINTVGSPKRLDDILQLPASTDCVPGAVPNGTYYSNTSGKGFCGIEKLITEELEYKFVDAPVAPMG
jgi:hypothetical protein